MRGFAFMVIDNNKMKSKLVHEQVIINCFVTIFETFYFLLVCIKCQ